MKKLSTIKKCGISVAAFIVCFALLVTYFTFIVPTRVSAAEPSNDNTLFEKITVDDECDYGDDITVPAVDGATVTFTLPNGVKENPAATANGYTVKANQVGIYTVTYEKDSISYDFNVKVALDEEYILKVDGNGASIPTYWKRGEAFELPGAKVVYYDDDNIVHEYAPASNVSLTITTSESADAFAPGDSVTPAQNGKFYVTYSATVGGAEGKKVFNETFTVNVQTTVNDTVSPTISISGVSDTVSVKRPVTLPKATATDSFDENVEIQVTVTDPNGDKVKYTDVDRYGYGYQAADVEYKEVEFDNDRAMTFYPMLEGAYHVSYVAVDDFGNKSSERRYTVNAGDHVAPVFHSIDEYMIPETWGLDVYKEGSDDRIESSGKITFPIPELVDNKDHMPVENDESGDLIKLYFRITDSDYSRTIISFNNVLSDTGNTFTADSYYGDNESDPKEVFTFGKDGFEFDFNKYKRKDSSGEDVDLPGTYTVYYRAEDQNGNRSSKTYTVTLQDTYEDKEAPSRADVTVPSYVSVTEKTMIIPSPSVQDSADTRAKVEYKIYSGDDATNFIDVDGGETAEFIKRSDDWYLVIDKDEDYEKALKLADTMYFFVKVTDKVGNVKTNATDAADYKTVEDKVKVISTSVSSELTVNSDIAFAPVDTGADGEESGLVSGKYIKAGGFTVAATEDMRAYTGFEVAVRDGNGDLLNVTLETVSEVKDGITTVYVKNITFKAGAAGTHTMIVRVFDVNGLSSAYGYTVDVEPSKSGSGSASSTTIGTTGSVNVKYQLHNATIENVGSSDNTYFVARKISGKRFALMGSEITVKAQGSYSVTDGYIDANDIASYVDFATSVTQYGSPYSFSITDTAAPVLEIQGVVPSYSALYNKDDNNLIKLPSVIAYTENGAATVKVEVTDPKSRKVTTTYVDATNEYTFKGELDGRYTVVYTATYGDATPATATYNINVGDVVGPEFSLSGGTALRLRVGDTFEFAQIELTGDDKNKTTGITVTKRLIDPSREEVTDATVSGSYTSRYDAKNNGSTITLSKPGTYEVEYTVTDAVGNPMTERVTITVTSSGSGSPTTFTTLSTVLIIVAVVLLAGVIVYVVRFRKVKSK